MECCFCKNKLSSKSNLIAHQKNSKYCIAIQEKKKNNQIDKNENINQKILKNCKYCKNDFSISNIKKHINICKEKYEKIYNNINVLKENYENIIKDLKQEIFDLKNSLIKFETESNIYKEFANKQSVINITNNKNNTNTNNTNKIALTSNLIMDEEKIKNIIDTKLDNNYILDGQKGVAQFAFDNMLKDDDGNLNYICTDPSRYIFKYRNEDGNIQKDINASKLTNKLLDAGLKIKSSDMTSKLWTNDDGTIDIDKFQLFVGKMNEIIMIKNDNSKFKNELATITSI